VAAVKKAFTDVGREVPDDFRQRTLGARDLTG
jgi:limonene 1,2-monooxygenase